MATLFGRAPKDSFQELLKLENTGAGLDSTLRSIQDGTGSSSPLKLSTTSIALNGAVWPSSVGTAGQVLTAGSNGTLSWATPVTPTSALSALSDTNIASPTSGQYLSFNGSKWVNTTGVSHITDLSDVTFFTPQIGQVLTYNGTVWTNQLPGFGYKTVYYSNAALTMTYSHLGSLVRFYGNTSYSVALPPLSNTANGQTVGFHHVGSGTITITPAAPDTGSIINFAANGVASFAIAPGDTVTLTKIATGWLVVNGSVSVVNSTAFTSAISGVTNGLASTASPNFSGTPTAPTATAGTNTTQLATTAFVTGALNNMSLNSLVDVTVGTPINGQVLTFNGTAWVPKAGSGGVASFNTRTGDITLQSSDVTSALGFTPANASTVNTLAPLASPALTGTPTAPTPASSDNSTAIATTAYVKNQAATAAGLKQIISNFPGNISPYVGQLRWYPSGSITLVQVSLFIATAPTSAITVDIKKNGISVFGSGSKPSIALGSNKTVAFAIPSTNLTTNDYLTMDIVSGTSGADMTARIDYQ